MYLKHTHFVAKTNNINNYCLLSPGELAPDSFAQVNLILTITLWGWSHCYGHPHFTDEENEAWAINWFLNDTKDVSGRGRVGVTDTEWVENRDAVKHPTIHRIAPTPAQTKNYPTQMSTVSRFKNPLSAFLNDKQKKVSLAVNRNSTKTKLLKNFSRNCWLPRLWALGSLLLKKRLAKL